MKLGKDDNLYRIIQIIQIVSALFIGYFLFINENITMFLLVVLENAMITTAVALYINKKNENEFKSAEKDFINSLNNNKNTYDVKFTYNHDEKFENIYKALDEIISDMKDREKMREEVLRLINTASSSVELSKMLADLIPKLASATNSEWGAFYQANEITNKLELKFSMGFSKNIYNEFDISIGEGFIGKAALSGKVNIVENIPEDTIFATRTVLGKLWPRNMMFAPIINKDSLLGVVVLGSINVYKSYEKGLMEFINHYLGLAIGNGITYDRTRRLTSELQFQNKLIQSLNEELEYKVSEHTSYLNGVLDSIQDICIYAVDKNGLIMSWNKKAEAVFGYSASEIIGENVSLLFDKETVTDEFIEKRRDIAKNAGRYEEKSWRVKKDGSICYVDVLLVPIYDGKNEFIGITSISKEITE